MTIRYLAEFGSLELCIQGKERGWTIVLDRHRVESMSVTALANYVGELEAFHS